MKIFYTFGKICMRCHLFFHEIMPWMINLKLTLKYPDLIKVQWIFQVGWPSWDFLDKYSKKKKLILLIALVKHIFIKITENQGLKFRMRKSLSENCKISSLKNVRGRFLIAFIGHKWSKCHNTHKILTFINRLWKEKNANSSIGSKPKLSNRSFTFNSSPSTILNLLKSKNQTEINFQQIPCIPVLFL